MKGKEIEDGRRKWEVEVESLRKQRRKSNLTPFDYAQGKLRRYVHGGHAEAAKRIGEDGAWQTRGRIPWQ